jgi:hypothetical protein
LRLENFTKWRIIFLEHFQQKWEPILRMEMRKNK